MLNQLLDLKPPVPYEPGEPDFWTDPHISRQMLAAHLAQDTDAASYRPERIDSVCRFLQRRLPLREGCRVADLGCGPGLYSARLARMGCRVTGIDLSENSIGYARKQAETAENPPEYRAGNYLDWNETDCYDAAIMVSEDYGVLPPGDRRLLLRNIHHALRAGGAFALDVAGLAAFHAGRRAEGRSWSVSSSGFWRPHPHLVLEERFRYPEIPASCDRYIVLDGELKDYRVYLTYYSPQSIADELEAGGFAVEGTFSNLSGDPWREDSPQVGVLCRKR